MSKEQALAVQSHTIGVGHLALVLVRAGLAVCAAKDHSLCYTRRQRVLNTSSKRPKRSESGRSANAPILLEVRFEFLHCEVGHQVVLDLPELLRPRLLLQ